MASASDETEASSKPRNPDHEDLDFPLARQSSIYSLTLDEIQNAVLEPGKTFGSMNMDEFLANIWSAEEGSALASCAAAAASVVVSDVLPATAVGSSGGGGLRRQGSLTVPAPLCRKTVDEVWAEIHREQQPQHQQRKETARSAPRQPTFGEMTLEDFLVRAGVVRESYDPIHAPPPPPPLQYDVPEEYTMGVVGASGESVYQIVGNGSEYTGAAAAAAMSVNRVGNGYAVAPVSPGSPEGSTGRYKEAETGVGKKRAAEGGVEKVVERRQRRMIKNRESAARSRARKQAYTVELEAELNNLKEENARLREEERRALVLRKQLLLKSMTDQAQANPEKTIRMLRRLNSCPW